MYTEHVLVWLLLPLTQILRLKEKSIQIYSIFTNRRRKITFHRLIKLYVFTYGLKENI